MAEDQTDVFWREHDKVRQKVDDLRVTVAVHSEQLEQQSKQFHVMNAEQSQRHGELLATISGVTTEVKRLDADFNQRKGAKESTSRQIWLAFSLLGALFAALTYFSS